jgi:polynucleotide 5'-hydroxyl-kinase GRC3/NOL9
MTDSLENLAAKLGRRADLTPMSCLFLGGTDTGKTTLVARLAARLAENYVVAVVDADVGQSHIGPPGAVSWAMVTPDMAELSSLDVKELYFVGAITPVGHLLPLSAGIAQAYHAALRQARIVVIDTGGFIHDSAARALWWHVHHRIQQPVVAAVQREKELETLLAGIDKTAAGIFRIPCDPRVRIKTPAQRTDFRNKRFQDYFKSRQTVTIDLSKVNVQWARPEGVAWEFNPTGRLAALRDSEGRDRVLAIITDWQPDHGMTLTGPPVAAEEIRCIIVGDVQLNGLI